MIELERLNPTRLIPGIGRRLSEIPHSIAWESSKKGIANRKNLESFKGRYKGEKLFLIANGPSLKDMDLSVLKNEYTMCMNRFYMYFDRLNFTPTFLTCVQDLVLEQFKDDFEKLECITFFNWRFRNEFSKAIFLKESYSINPFFQTDLTKATQIGGTVTFASLQLAYYLGFKEVIIIGMDHSFAEKGTPNKLEVRTHEEDKSHFDPNYFPKGIKWKLPDLKKSEYSYDLARIAFEQDGRKIIDATVGGHCMVFEKGVLKDYLTAK
ncbi:6-hydroxymethylpterin diphosphokinase MptE-like protein [Dyadobacter sp. CY351]|uniref:6-hydroxymethylpterin diphosphokinase MptE-like protein n=1 Tax=Dyadobacter sp. CY351 TaxID=2909337 RepID=UPI001F38EA70|nr:6-hydroxymethylpterin diphosphokinase MptE-like protein [Dyadobacter sp. CY351]MCF2518422.1 DUF115 domain-containing protein [Dyadobacter sp. CY351]